MKKVFFVRHKRDNAPYLLVTVNPGGTDFQPLSDEADDVADVFDSVYRNRPINKQELDAALDDDFTIEGPINPTRGNLNLLQDFLSDTNQPLSPRKRYPSAKSFDISSVPLGFSDKDGKVNLTEYKARNFIYEQTKSTFNYEVKRVRALWDPGLSIPGTGRRGGWRCPVGTRYGGQITDRFGRNCGWGVARRIANAITNIGERMENLDDRRRGRRVERRNRRMLERLGRAEGAGRAERGLRGIAEVLDGGEGTPTPAPERPRGRGVQARRRARNTTEALADARDRGLRDSERRRVRRELEKPGAARTETAPKPPAEEKPIPAAPRKRPRNARKPAKRPQGEARNDVTKPVGGPNETEDYAGYVNRKYNEYAENVRKIRERGGRAGFLTRREWYDINKSNLDDAWRKKGKGEAPDDFMPPTPGKKRRRKPDARKKPPVQDKEPTPQKPEPKKIDEEFPNQEPTIGRADEMLAEKGWKRAIATNPNKTKWKKGNWEITLDKDQDGDVFVAKNPETGEIFQVARGAVPLDQQLNQLENLLADRDPDFLNKKPKKKKRMWTIDYGKKRPRNRMRGGAGRGENRNIAGDKALEGLTDDELKTELERINNDEFMKDWDIRPAEREAIKKNIEAELKYRKFPNQEPTLGRAIDMLADKGWKREPAPNQIGNKWTKGNWEITLDKDAFGDVFVAKNPDTGEIFQVARGEVPLDEQLNQLEDVLADRDPDFPGKKPTDVADGKEPNIVEVARMKIRQDIEKRAVKEFDKRIKKDLEDALGRTLTKEEEERMFDAFNNEIYKDWNPVNANDNIRAVLGEKEGDAKQELARELIGQLEQDGRKAQDDIWQILRDEVNEEPNDAGKLRALEEAAALEGRRQRYKEAKKLWNDALKDQGGRAEGRTAELLRDESAERRGAAVRDMKAINGVKLEEIVENARNMFVDRGQGGMADAEVRRYADAITLAKKYLRNGYAKKVQADIEKEINQALGAETDAVADVQLQNLRLRLVGRLKNDRQKVEDAKAIIAEYDRNNRGLNAEDGEALANAAQQLVFYNEEVRAVNAALKVLDERAERLRKGERTPPARGRQPAALQAAEDRNIAQAEFDMRHNDGILDVAGIKADKELADAVGMDRFFDPLKDLDNEYNARRAEKESVLKREARAMRVAGETTDTLKKRDRVRAVAEGLEEQGLREIEQIKKKQDTALRIAQDKDRPLRARYEAAKEMARNVAELDAARIRVRQAREALANVNGAGANPPKNTQIFDSDSPIKKILDDVKPLLGQEVDRIALDVAVQVGREDFENIDKDRLIQDLRIRGGDELARSRIARNEDEIKANLRMFRNKMKQLEGMDDVKERNELIDNMKDRIRMAARLEAENAAIADILSNSTPPKTESTPPQAVNAGGEIDADRAVNDIGQEYERLIGSELDSNQKAQMRRKYIEKVAQAGIDDELQKDKERFDREAEKLENERNRSDAVDEMRRLADESLDFMEQEVVFQERTRDQYLGMLENANEATRASLLQRLAVNQALMDMNRRKINALRKMKDEYVEKFLQERQDERDAAAKPNVNAPSPLQAETVIKIGNPFKAKVVPELDLGIDFGQGKGMGEYKEIKNPKIKNEKDAIKFVKDGGNLREVPHEYWQAAIEANSSRKKIDKTKRFRQLSKNGGIIGDTRLFVLRDADGKSTNRGIVFKAAEAADNVGELVGWNLAHQVGIIKGGAVADGENLGGDKFIMIPFVFNDVPDGNNITSAGGAREDNYHIRQVQRKVPKQLKPNMYAARLNQELLNYVLAVSDRHGGNGMAKGVELPNGDVAAHVIPLDLGWAGKVYAREGIGDPLRVGNGADPGFWRDLDDDLRAASPELKTRIQDAVINAYDNAIKTVGDAISGGEAEFVRQALKNFKGPGAKPRARFLYKVLKDRHGQLVARRRAFLLKIGRP